MALVVKHLHGGPFDELRILCYGALAAYAIDARAILYLILQDGEDV